MADAKPPSTSDLLLLMTGLQIVKAPVASADSGEDYYLNPPVQTRERTLRETIGNPLYLYNPFAAWKEVRFRDWLISKLFAGITDNKHDFTAPNHDHGNEVTSSSVRSISAGISLKNTKEQALWSEKDPEIVAMRFNLRIPFNCGSFTRVHDAGLGLVKDRAGVYAGEDAASSILNIST